MEETKFRYILLYDRVGYTLERSILALGLPAKSTPTQVLKGELLETLPAAEQPLGSTRIALVGMDRKSLRLECRSEDLARLSDEDANLLLAISSHRQRYETFIDRKRLDFGRRLSPGDKVFVTVKGISKELAGIAWYKGELPSNLGTMFGVELIKNQGQGTSDGTFRSKRYFTCPPDSAVFVGLDKLKPRDDPDSNSPKSPERDDTAQANLKSRLKFTVMQSFLKGKPEPKPPHYRFNQVLEIYHRVVTFLEDHPVRGTVRYIGEEKDSSGNVRTIVGLEMDDRIGSGTGKRNGRQVFVCKSGYAAFVDLETVIPERDFDENPTEATGKTTLHKQDPAQEQIRKDKSVAKSMSYSVNRPSGSESGKKVKRTNSFDSAEVILAAGESSQTDTAAFIEKQRQMLEEIKSAKKTANRDNSEAVDMREEDRTSQIAFQDDHSTNTPPNNTDRESIPLTKQPGLSNIGFVHQDTARKSSYTDYVNIEKDDYEKLMAWHESSRHGWPKNTPNSTDKCAVMEDEERKGSSQTDTAAFIEQQRSLTEIVVEDEERKDIQINQMAVDIGLEVGSMVEVPMAQGLPRYGVIRWIGNLPQLKDKLVAGLELEEDLPSCSDGTFYGQRYFTCPEQRGFFTLLEHCRQDSRVASKAPNSDANVHADEEKVEQHNSLQREFREMEQQFRNFQGQLQEKDLQVANLNDQLREKEQRLENSERQKEQQLRNFQERLQEKELLETSLHEQLREKEETSQRQLREMEQQLRGKDEQENNLQRQLGELEEQLANFQEQFREKEVESDNLQQQVATLQGQLRAKDREVNELETTLSTAQQALSEQQRHQSPDWVISRDQIQLTDKVLGKGGWGSVVEGKHCGCAVAVKQIHELIISVHNRNLFKREMDIASKCRHPCLLQFIGATNDEGSPLFVTELMESSLRALLEQRPLSAAEISIISLDVARALSYLHHKTPPIIHRDISSANVLLWRQGDQWRGKVSDYGTANFMQHTMTVAPGAVIYMAPEALTSNQTIKVDVYSFGFLLCEMCIRELPDPEKRDQQIAMVTNRLLRALIRGCVQAEPETRPSMEEIIEELEEPV